MRYSLLLLACIAIGCGGGGGSGGGGTPPPPPDEELNSAPVGTYFGVIDWDSNDQSCSLIVHANEFGQPNGQVTLVLQSGSGGVPGTLVTKKLSLIGDKVVSIRQTQNGVQISHVSFSNVLINVLGPQ